jgi:hypothetical protein
MRTVLSVIQPASWAAARRIIDANPYLISNSTDDILYGMIIGAREGDASLLSVIEQYRKLFRRCILVGVDAAFAELAGELKERLYLHGRADFSVDELLED